MKLRIERYPVPTIEQLAERANLDSDSASCFMLGRNLESMTGCIVIVKGNREGRRVRELLIEAGLLTAGKPVVGDVP